MTVQILVAPAGAGKTEYVLNLARQAAAGLRATPHVVVPSGVQVRSCRRLLARFQGHPLYLEMSAAPRRLHEVPYSITRDGAVENGIMDALFGDDGSWTLVEFKTDEVRDDAAPTALYARTGYLNQTRRYLAAASTRLVQAPAAALCLLDYAGEVRVEREPSRG